MDFLTVPTATFRVLFVLVMLKHDRRRLLHFAVTEHPTALWTARQLSDAAGAGALPGHLLHDCDAIFGAAFSRQATALGLAEVRTAPRSPWQNPYAERIIGSIRRECLNHVIVLGEGHLKRILASYADYYGRSRTHLSLAKDAPEERPNQSIDDGAVVELDCVGGLHHYVRVADVDE